MKRNILGFAGVFIALALFSNQSCKKRKFGSTLQSSNVTKIKGQMINGYVSITENIVAAGDVEAEIEIVDPSTDVNFVNLEISLNTNDSSYFQKNKETLATTLTIFDSNNATKKSIVGQKITSGSYSWSATGNFTLLGRDVIKVLIKDLPAAFTGGAAYIYANSRKVQSEKVTDNLNTYGSWDSQAAVLFPPAGVNPIPKIFETKSSAVDLQNGIYNAGMDLSLISMTGDELSADDGSGTSTSCGKSNIQKKSKVLFDFKDSKGKPPYDIVAVSQNNSIENCDLYTGAVFLAEAGAALFSPTVGGIEAGDSLIDYSFRISDQMGAPGSVQSRVLAESVPAALAEPRSYKETVMAGVYSKGTKMSFALDVNEDTGLNINGLNLNFFYPVNSPQSQGIAFDGKGFQARLVDGQKVIGDLKFSYEEKTYSYVDQTVFPDIATGKYVLEIIAPATAPDGLFIKISLQAEKAKAIVGELNPSILADFENRDKASGVAALDWTPANKMPPEYKDTDLTKNRRKVAMIQTLRAMEEVRDTYHMAVNKKNPFNMSIQNDPARNSVDLSTIIGCLGNEAKHWNDLTIHYYCLHSSLRSCYTGGIRSTAPEMEKALKATAADIQSRLGKDDPIPTESEIRSAATCKFPTIPLQDGRIVPVVPYHPQYLLPTLRQYVYQQCATGKDVKFPSNSPVPTFPGGCSASTTNYIYAPSDYDRENFSWLNAEKERGLVFRYMMDAPTFGFDEQDQQDIINAFWRVENPADPKDCAKRPVRAIDPQDGTHCLANARKAKAGFKVQNPLQTPADR
jgi:hypothetical protein